MSIVNVTTSPGIETDRSTLIVAERDWNGWIVADATGATPRAIRAKTRAPKTARLSLVRATLVGDLLVVRMLPLERADSAKVLQ